MNNRIYECPFCGKKYESPNDYMVCVNQCFEDKKEREAYKKAAEREKQRNQEAEKIIEIYNELMKKKKEWENKYNRKFSGIPDEFLFIPPRWFF